MYSRGFGTAGDVKLPEKYDGTALIDLPPEEEKSSPQQMPLFSDTQKREVKISPNEISTDAHTEAAANAEKSEETKDAGLFSFAPLKLISKIIPDGSHLGKLIPKIEIEELIILGIAAFLFFSKSGDKECALMLFALIFIS